MKNDEFIVIRGARQHNLKNISLKIPRDKLTVITGLSGSGKSSLAFDTLYAEGQRRYVESLSTFARRFLEILEKPLVESIDGLSPTIAIEQHLLAINPRSTVGTITEIYDYLRLLFSRIGQPYCYNCSKPIQGQSSQQIVDSILELQEGSKLNILAPVVRERKGEYQKELELLRQKGFARVRVDGEILDLAHHFSLDKNKKHNIDVYVDRLILRKTQGFLSSLKARVYESVETALKLSDGLVKVELPESQKESLYSEKFACLDCGISYPTPEPRTFSFNSPLGACGECDGLGYIENHILCSSCQGTRLKKEALFFKISERNIAELSSFSLKVLLEFFKTLRLDSRQMLIADRILKEILSRLQFLNNVGVSYLSLDRPADTLSGGENQRIRLATQIGSYLVGVTYVLDEPSIGLHCRDNLLLLKTLEQLRDLGNTVVVVEHDKETIEHADHIIDLGPGAGSLGGHVVAQGTLKEILNTPTSLTGKYLSGLMRIPVPLKRRPLQNKGVLTLAGVSQNNLKDITLHLPLGVFVCITGVSGSGKSTLVIDTLYALLMSHLHDTKTKPLKVTSIDGLDAVDKVLNIDQLPIGRTPRSNPATYVGFFSAIRDLFSQIPESKMRGFKPGSFSFNVKGGRCEKCRGGGVTQVEMHFLANTYVTCDACGGRRYTDEILEIKYKGKSISDVLEMTVDDASVFFENIPTVYPKLHTLKEVGLGYLTLGQRATTLSGGEAQRIKLAKELSKRSTGKTLYILDEPSTGLHFDDIKKLLEVLHLLVDVGNTVVVIEHNLEIIKTADYVIDLGPEGGENGGQILAEGTPEEIAACKQSYTGLYLGPLL